MNKDTVKEVLDYHLQLHGKDGVVLYTIVEDFLRKYPKVLTKQEATEIFTQKLKEQNAY